jgi:hypothetical protein
MKHRTRFAIVVFCFSLCAEAAIIANFPRQRASKIDDDIGAFGATDLASAYQYTASSAQQKFSLSHFESIIRRDRSLMRQCGRIEFGSVEMEEGTALVQVLCFAPDGGMQPFLYKLVPDGNSWRIESVQRMWFVPRSRLLRGLRV